LAETLLRSFTHWVKPKMSHAEARRRRDSDRINGIYRIGMEGFDPPKGSVALLFFV